MPAPDTAEVHLSVVTPAYNEADNLPDLVREIADAVSPLGQPCEILVVDDGSTDASRDVLRRLMTEHPQLRVIALQQNSGQTAALDAGLRAARGSFLATLDADRQNDPREIPRLLARVAAGDCDFANGWRRERNDPWLRLVSTRIANAVRNSLTHESIHDSACGLKVFRRECIERLKLFNGLHRFLPTLVRIEGFRVQEFPVAHRPRERGLAKYGVWNRVFKALRDCLAVRWMQRRALRYHASERERDDVERTHPKT
ncbi:MAG: glycosyltransferase family 2 protein [Phycisphaerae bacterium]